MVSINTDSRFRHRFIGASLLTGNGIEIGALNRPMQLHAGCSVEYLDIDSYQNLRQLFPEIGNIVENKYTANISTHSLSEITKKTFDFVVINHVLEHVPNPIKTIAHVYSAINATGCLALSIPDKRNSYDRHRPLTAYEHILADYYLNTSETENHHLVESLASKHSDVFETKEKFLLKLQLLKERRDHLHVWTCETFKEHLEKIFLLLKIDLKLIYESKIDHNGFEYFAIFCKNMPPERERALKIIAAVYATRPDLQAAFPGKAGLMQWAVRNGCSNDSDAAILSEYQPVYKSLCDE